MLILTLRTDKPLAEISLHENKNELGHKKWEGHRQLSATIHKEIEKLLKTHGKQWQDIGGVVFFAGPGSFTGLRIGASVASALAYGQNIPLINSSGKDWTKNGISKISSGKNNRIALPKYGSKPNITKPKK